MAYTTIDDPSVYFQIALYTGNETARAITFDGNSDLDVDWIWLKSRSATGNHHVYDTVRGTQKHLRTNLTNAEGTNGGTDGVTAFGSDGFTVGANTGSNADGVTFVGWGWKAGTSFTNDASSTGVGSIDSAGSVSTDAGFSIISFTDDTSNATIAHGLGVVPKAIIIKNRAAGEDWYSYWQPLGNDKQLRLSSTAAVADAGSMWNDTTPTSSVFSLDADAAGLSSGAYIAYCFAEKKGYSKIGSYVGNGNVDGTFVYCGFKPAFILQKNTARAGSGWGMFDTTRTPFNVSKGMLIASANAVEDASNAARVDFLSNGFKWRTTDNWFNDNGATTIFIAFADNPFVTSTGVPATAR